MSIRNSRRRPKLPVPEATRIDAPNADEIESEVSSSSNVTAAEAYSPPDSQPGPRIGVLGTPSKEPAAEPDQFQVPNRPRKFEDTHVRVTTYLRKDVHIAINRLRADGSIESVTALVNAALRMYLLKHYGIKT